MVSCGKGGSSPSIWSKKIITYEEELVYSRPKVVTLTHIIKNLMEVIISRDKVAVTG